MDTLEHGRTLAERYTVDREIGAGGMATVYLARDTRHDRRVALKVLRPELGAVLGVERFLTEIRVTANLQHPNLLPLFDSGEANGLLYYVMPFVDGESLRDRLKRERQLGIDEAIRIAVAIASALDYAHKHGVIHRDLKPENILLQSGQPVVADFGIALAVTNAGGARVTQTGLSLGTPQYMSPEQATGEHTLDARTDIYSLGAMVYEMLAGEPPHTGGSVQAIIARVLTDKPRPLRLIRNTVPPHVEAAVEKALAKLPADRFHTPHDFSEALQGRVIVASNVSTPIEGSSRAAWRSPIPWVAALIVTTGLAIWGWLDRGVVNTAPAGRFALSLPSHALPDPSSESPLSISPDGRRIVYSGQSSTGRHLYVRALDQLEPRLVPGTQSASNPSISPDGRWVAWSFAGKVRKTPVDGGPTVDIVDLQTATLAEGLAWLSNDELIVSAPVKGAISALHRVSASGGPLKQFATLDPVTREVTQSNPFVLREHGLVLYTSSMRGTYAERLAAAKISDGTTTVFDVPLNLVLGYAEGHVIYLRIDGTLAAVPFDPRTVRLTGPPHVLLQGVESSTAALSPTGTLLYVEGTGSAVLVSVDERGASTTLVSRPGRYAHPRLSPDGRRLAVDLAAGTTDIWTYELATGTPTRLTAENNNDRPEWTVDGKSLLYSATQLSQDYVVRLQPADGSGRGVELYRGPNPVREVSLTADGKTLVYREDNPDSLRDIRMVSLEKKDVATPLVATRADELMPRLSPDGKWLAYQSNESGQYEIYVRPFPGGGARTTVSNGGGTEPMWSRDGRLFYRHGPELVAATYSATSGFSITNRRVLFSGPYQLHPFHPNYDVTADGKHFIMVKPESDDRKVIVVVNWFEELRRLVAAK